MPCARALPHRTRTPLINLQQAGRGGGGGGGEAEAESECGMRWMGIKGEGEGSLYDNTRGVHNKLAVGPLPYSWGPVPPGNQRALDEAEALTRKKKPI